tara:strand:+ start:62 stop:364 length:303 start_codon:yes stop_codon:yes gene_type:complete
MNKFFLTALLLLFSSCSGFGDAAKVLRNEKINSTDEFLVEKRDPLVLPPDYKKIPKPGEEINVKNNDNEKENIEKIFKITDESQSEPLSSEQSILEKIRN